MKQIYLWCYGALDKNGKCSMLNAISSERQRLIKHLSSSPACQWWRRWRRAWRWAGRRRAKPWRTGQRSTEGSGWCNLVSAVWSDELLGTASRNSCWTYQQTGKRTQERGGSVVYWWCWGMSACHAQEYIMLMFTYLRGNWETFQRRRELVSQYRYTLSFSIRVCWYSIMFFWLPASLLRSLWCCPKQWWSQKHSMCLESSSVETGEMLWINFSRGLWIHL